MRGPTKGLSAESRFVAGKVDDGVAYRIGVFDA